MLGILRRLSVIHVLGVGVAATACDDVDRLADERAAMERDCAFDVGGDYAITSIGAEPEEGQMRVEVAGEDNTTVTVTITRAAAFTLEAPFLARVDAIDGDTPLVFQGSNRFIGAGDVGQANEVRASLVHDATPGDRKSVV